MFQIRRNVFETNSSSTHSVSFAPGKPLKPSTLKIDEDGFIHCYLDEYGWDTRTYRSQDELLSYLVTMISEITDHKVWCTRNIKEEIEAIQQTAEFKRVSDAISAYTGAEGLILDESEGYIDHQSGTDRYSTLDKFLDKCGTSIIEFVFGDNVVHTDNDNEGDYDWNWE